MRVVCSCISQHMLLIFLFFLKIIKLLCTSIAVFCASLLISMVSCLHCGFSLYYVLVILCSLFKAVFKYFANYLNHNFNKLYNLILQAFTSTTFCFLCVLALSLLQIHVYIKNLSKFMYFLIKHWYQFSH